MAGGPPPGCPQIPSSPRRGDKPLPIRETPAPPVHACPRGGQGLRPQPRGRARERALGGEQGAADLCHSEVQTNLSEALPSGRMQFHLQRLLLKVLAGNTAPGSAGTRLWGRRKTSFGQAPLSSRPDGACSHSRGAHSRRPPHPSPATGAPIRHLVDSPFKVQLGQHSQSCER